MAKKKVDPKVIASKQKYEIDYLCSCWKSPDGKNLKAQEAKYIISKVGKSRRVFNGVLRYLGYTYSTKKKK